MVEIVGFDDKYRYRVTHDKCGNILEYSEFEVINSSHTDISGSTEAYDLIICPKCAPFGTAGGFSNKNYSALRERLPYTCKVDVTDRKRK